MAHDTAAMAPLFHVYVYGWYETKPSRWVYTTDRGQFLGKSCANNWQPRSLCWRRRRSRGDLLQERVLVRDVAGVPQLPFDMEISVQECRAQFRDHGIGKVSSKKRPRAPKEIGALTAGVIWRGPEGPRRCRSAIEGRQLSGRCLPADGRDNRNPRPPRNIGSGCPAGGIAAMRLTAAIVGLFQVAVMEPGSSGGEPLARQR